MSPVFSGYCHTGADNETIAPTPAPQSAGYINTFGRETLIDPALTSALQAPVKVGSFDPPVTCRETVCFYLARFIRAGYDG